MNLTLQLNTRNRKIFAVVWAWFEVFLFAGIYFGWGSLVFMLKEDDVYKNACPVQPGTHKNGAAGNSTSSPFATIGLQNSTQETPIVVDLGTKQVNLLYKEGCVEQDKIYNLGFSIISGLWPYGYGVIGQLGHKFGTRFIRLFCIISFIVGSLMMAFTNADIPWLVFIGQFLYGVSGCGLLFTNLQLSYLFKRGRTIVCGLMTGAFDSSIATSLYIKLAYDGGISRQTCYVFVACVHVVTLISTFVWMPKMYIDIPDTPDQEIEVGEENEERKTSDTGLFNDDRIYKSNFEGSQILIDNDDDDFEEYKAIAGGDSEGKELTLYGHIFSQVFLLHTLWYGILQLRFFYFIGTLNPWLERISSDEKEVSTLTNVSMYCMMGGVVTSVTAGTFFDCQKHRYRNSKSKTRSELGPLVLPLSAGSFLGLVLTIMQMIEHKVAVYCSFIAVTAFRSFLYAIGNGYLSAMFPSRYFSALGGILMIVTGSFGFFQYGLFSWTEAYTEAYRHVEIFLICMVLISLVHPVYQLIKCKKSS